MLERLTLRNFQKHAKLEVVLEPGITVICGKTDSGKSSVVRALKWLCTNRPSGDFFIRRDPQGETGISIRVSRRGRTSGVLSDGDSFTRRSLSGETNSPREEPTSARTRIQGSVRVVSVSLQLDGNAKITRRRGGGTNTYRCRPDVYKAFGTEVPEGIANLLNVGEINFSGQHDSPFWFMKSPGEVSRELNAIVNLGLIDSTLAEIASELRKAKSEVTISEERLEIAQENKTKLSWVVEADRDFRTVEALYTQWEETRQKSSQLSGLLEKLRTHSKALVTLPDAILAKANIVSALESLLKTRGRQEKLESLLQRITKAREDIWHASESLTKAEKEMSRLTKNKCPICGGALNPAT